MIQSHKKLCEYKNTISISTDYKIFSFLFSIYMVRSIDGQWSTENPHWIMEAHMQHPTKIKLPDLIFTMEVTHPANTSI